MPDETTPQLTKNGYETEIGALAKRTLRRLADNETGELTYEEDEIRPLLSETETFHQEYPFSAIKHGRYDPSPGAWSWINDTTPSMGLYRQALDIVAQDVSRLVELYAESEAYTYQQDETVYIQQSSDSRTETSVEENSSGPTDEGSRTRLTVTTDASNFPTAGTGEHKRIARAVEDAVDGALYECGCVGHDTSVSIEENQ